MRDDHIFGEYLKVKDLRFTEKYVTVGAVIKQFPLPLYMNDCVNDCLAFDDLRYSR